MNISDGSSARGSQSQDFELNLASIIDCMTVLITFLLASTAFISIGIMDAGVAAAGTSATDTTPPPVNLSVELGKDHLITLKTSGKSTNTQSVSAKDGQWNMDDLTQKLAALHQQWPTVEAITLTAENSIEYDDVIKVMDTTRKTIPVVLLGGF
jgi:biopolymer transport protein ExbD